MITNIKVRVFETEKKPKAFLSAQEPSVLDTTKIPTEAYAIISWESSREGSSIVDYGLTKSRGNIVKVDEKTSLHEVKIRGLKKRKTRYFFKVKTTGNDFSFASKICSFTTLLRYDYDYKINPKEPYFSYDKRRPEYISRPIPFVKENYDKKKELRVIRLLAGVDRGAYKQHIIDCLIKEGMSDQEKAEAIVKFVQDAIYHNPLEQAFFGDCVKYLELHEAWCKRTNQIVLAGLLNKAGFKTRKVSLRNDKIKDPNARAHQSIEVFYDNAWHYVDADMLKNGLMFRKEDGTIPSLEWLRTKPNYYLIDSYPIWVNARYDEAAVNSAGKPVKGYNGAVNIEDSGYFSALFGAPLEFPPSRPVLVKQRDGNSLNATLKWEKSYDRDNDFSHYVVSIGTKSGMSDVGVYKSKEESIAVKLPRYGRYFWRVQAKDNHTRFRKDIYYISSKEGGFVVRKNK